MDQGKVAALAGAFADVVHEWTTPAELEEVKRLNRTEYANSSICATHDFFDANEAMAEAFRRIFGRAIWLPCDVEEGLCPENEADLDLQLWNAAWDQAKKGWLS
jgi:hypothetical protein